MIEKWDKRFMDVALLVSSWSKDPSTQCGAIIVDSDRHPISVGYNGLPAFMYDDPEILNDREQKYKYVIHAERNAIDNSPSTVNGCTLYVTHPCCTDCAEYIVKSGIKRVVLNSGSERFMKQWKCEDAIELLKSKDVEVTILGEK